MAVTVKNKNGKDVVLLNPSEKARKFADELKYKQLQTNDGELKLDVNGYPMRPTREQRAYRAGYLAHCQDSSMAYCANKGIPSKAKENRKKYFASRKKSKQAKR